jgi:hypothetical protein
MLPVPDSTSGLWSLAAVVIGPLIATIVAVFSKSDFQRKQDEYDYKLKRLETIKKIIDLRQSLNNLGNTEKEFENYNNQFARILDDMSQSETVVQSDAISYLKAFEKHRLPWRLFFLPKQVSTIGKIYKLMYYWLIYICIIVIANAMFDFIAQGGWKWIGLPEIGLDTATLFAIFIQIAMLFVFRALAIGTARRKGIVK